jgi:hypothetical protein
MSARRRHPSSASFVVRGEVAAETTPCANCGRRTADAVLSASLSVVGPAGGRRFAPPIPLCDRCRRDVIYERVWLPTWCAACQQWRPFSHHHDVSSPVAHRERTPLTGEPAPQTV